MDNVIGITNVHRSVLRIDIETVIKIVLEFKYYFNQKNPWVKDPFNGIWKDRTSQNN